MSLVNELDTQIEEVVSGAERLVTGLPFYDCVINDYLNERLNEARRKQLELILILNGIYAISAHRNSVNMQ